MSEATRSPTHFRLLAKLKAIGPYLREPQSHEGRYYFDCLSVCVDDKKSPESREFWGWWMELESAPGGFTANYYIGQYDDEGNWNAVELEEKVAEEVSKTQAVFHQKLQDTLQSFFELSVEYHDDSQQFA